ncbi:MAG: stage IV sporulation protein A, partial [Clostridia bacterium]|nr:stage IV sporulation protein A [Clostridia bacterium]
METFSVYQDIAARTNGEIYVGVVGPVRTGKSTFIKRFMKELVLPNVEGEKKKRYTDELPQSAAGKTIMTTEPKFVPENGAEITAGNAVAKVRLIDCVGFPVEGSAGFEEEDGPRLVKTPWNENPVPFTRAAEEGTLRVIRDHSTIGILMTTDGSVTGIPREAYVEGEKQALKELKDSKKPFVVVLNCANPEKAEALRASLEEEYCVPVISLNAETADKERLAGVLERILYEFPVLSIDVDLPDWMRVLDADSPLISEVLAGIREIAPKISKMNDCALLDTMYPDSERLNPPTSVRVDAATGKAYVKVDAKEGTFYRVLGEQCGVDIQDDFALMSYVYGLKDAKKLYERAGQAFADAKEYGYGIVPPESDEMQLLEPKVVKKSGRVGVNLHADAPSYHIIRVDVSGEVRPALGGEEQSEAFAKQISENMQTEPDRAWNTNMFGRTLKDML